MAMKYFFNPLGGVIGKKINTTPIRFDYTGAAQEYIVPLGCKRLSIDCVGARGSTNNNISTPGRGGRVTCILNVKSKQKLYLYVGQAGSDSSFSNAFNGGGKGKEPTNQSKFLNGGGASDIRTVKALGGSWYNTSHTSFSTDYSLLSRLVVAGGGGGSNSDGVSVYGGAGGGLVGGTGGGNASALSSLSGKGGSQSSGGAGGSGSDTVGRSGDFGLGADGGTSSFEYGGGGGGGYYGGGSAGVGYPNWGMGGGGSSYTDPVLCSEVVHTQGYNNGNGYIIITPLEK